MYGPSTGSPTHGYWDSSRFCVHNYRSTPTVSARHGLSVKLRKVPLPCAWTLQSCLSRLIHSSNWLRVKARPVTGFLVFTVLSRFVPLWSTYHINLFFSSFFFSIFPLARTPLDFHPVYTLIDNLTPETEVFSPAILFPLFFYELSRCIFYSQTIAIWVASSRLPFAFLPPILESRGSRGV